VAAEQVREIEILRPHAASTAGGSTSDYSTHASTRDAAGNTTDHTGNDSGRALELGILLQRCLMRLRGEHRVLG
jgi:hypothetical protein